jgi:hypothetical protein
MLMIIAAVIALLLISFWYVSEGRRISAEGWVLYFHPNCSFCVKQKEYLGWGSYFIPSVNCLDREACSSVGVKSYPTWYNTITEQWHEGSILEGSVLEKLQLAEPRKQINIVVDKAQGENYK